MDSKPACIYAKQFKDVSEVSNPRVPHGKYNISPSGTYKTRMKDDVDDADDDQIGVFEKTRDIKNSSNSR